MANQPTISEVEKKVRAALKRPQRLKPNLSATEQETYKEIRGFLERYQDASKLPPTDLEKLNRESSHFIKLHRTRPVGGVGGPGGDTYDCIEGCQEIFDDCLGLGVPQVCAALALVCMAACFLIPD